MVMGPQNLSCVAIFAAVALHARAAGAEEDEGAEVAALLGYGVSSGIDVIGPGIGARVAYGGRPGFYVGALGLVHFGTSDEAEPDVRHYSQSLRFELGYGVAIEPLELRPSLRVGATHVTTPRDVDGSFWSPDVGAGVTFLVPLDGPFVGFDVEARMLTRLVQNGHTLFSIAAVGGYWVLGYRF
jgi:hypothetical protein